MIKPTLSVCLKENSYPIYIGSGLLKETELLQEHLVKKQVLIVTNQTIAELYLDRVQKALPDADQLLLPDGEQYKNLAQLERIWDALAQHHHHRDTTLIALGGGVIGDMVGFAAACYQRGVGFIQIPTTLLAQVDSSIGGKTAVNHTIGKNLIGAFYQPRAVIMDVDTLKTLPDREFNSGLAEIIKVALIRDAAFFHWLEENISALMHRDSKILITAIKRACEIKCEIVIKDEKELGERALLNLGHTFGHAIEKVLNYGEWLHGEAVAVGLSLAAQLSQQQKKLSAADVLRIQTLLQKAALPIHLPKNIVIEDLLAAMQMDKKIADSKLRLVLLDAIGNATLTNQLTITDIEPLLKSELS